MSKREKTATALQAAGAGVAVAAGWTINVAFGLAVLAVALVVFGVAVERRG